MRPARRFEREQARGRARGRHRDRPPARRARARASCASCSIGAATIRTTLPESPARLRAPAEPGDDLAVLALAGVVAGCRSPCHRHCQVFCLSPARLRCGVPSAGVSSTSGGCSSGYPTSDSVVSIRSSYPLSGMSHARRDRVGSLAPPCSSASSSHPPRTRPRRPARRSRCSTRSSRRTCSRTCSSSSPSWSPTASSSARGARSRSRCRSATAASSRAR